MMPHRKKSSKLAHFFLLPFSLCLVGVVAVSEVALAQTAEERKAEEDRVLKACRDKLNAQKFQEALLACQAALEDFKKTDNLRGQGLSLNNIGVNYNALEQYQKAIDNFQQSLKIVREVKDQRIERLVVGNLVTSYEKLGNYDKAIEYRLRGLEMVREVKDREGEVDSLYNLGNTYYALKQYQKAIEYYQQSLVIVKRLENNKSEPAINYNIGISYIALGDNAKGREFLLLAQELAKKIGDLDTETKVTNLLNEISKPSYSRQVEADRLLNQGNQQFQISQFVAALQSYQQALIIYREIKFRQGEVWGLGGTGLAYYNLDKYDKAIESYLQVLEIAWEIKDRLGEGNALGNLGNVYRNLGKYDKAIEFHLQHLEIAREIKDRSGEGQSLGNLGFAYDSLGKYDKAIEFHLQALAILREIKDRRAEGAVLGNLGIAYYALGKYDKAIEFQLQALAIAREIKNRRGEGQSLGDLGIAYYALGKYDKAIEFQLQKLAIAREIKDRRGEGQSLNNLAVAYGELNRDREEMIFYQQALTIFKEIGDRNSEGIALANLGSVLSSAKRPELAILFYKQSINVREAIRKDIKKLDKDLQQSYLATVERFYRALADTLLQQNRIIEALQVLDLLKVQELEDYLKNIKGSNRSAQGVRLLAPEKALSDQLLTINFDNSQDINNQLANQIQQLPKTEINKVPDYLNQIPQGTVLLYPFILGDRLEIILFAPNNLPIRRTTKISKDQLETLIVDFRTGLLDPSSEDFREPSLQLYNLLLKPIEAELAQFNAKTILYAPDGQLRYIPIAALYDGKQLLVEKYQISNLIAYTLSDFTPQPQNAPNILAGAFGGKAGDRKFGQTALPATVREVQAIANSFQNSVTLIEEQFSRKAIESKFKNHNILHLATHAEFNVGSPDQSFIIFGNGDKIRLNEITNWQIPNIDLIILSACQTGSGKLGDGLEILGFGYQVQKAGAKQAIASL